MRHLFGVRRPLARRFACDKSAALWILRTEDERVVPSHIGSAVIPATITSICVISSDKLQIQSAAGILSQPNGSRGRRTPNALTSPPSIWSAPPLARRFACDKSPALWILRTEDERVVPSHIGSAVIPASNNFDLGYLI